MSLNYKVFSAINKFRMIQEIGQGRPVFAILGAYQKKRSL